jgi:hypothetical protein
MVHAPSYRSPRQVQHAEGRAERDATVRAIAARVSTPGPARHGVPIRHPVTGAWAVLR